jgi:phosphohistidine phosphatase
MHQIARGLKSLGVELDVVISSPYLRARETAEILVKEIKPAMGLLFNQNLTPMGDLSSLITDINKDYVGQENIAVVGHEPQLSELVSILISGDTTLDIVMKKGGVCCLSIERLRFDRCAVLEWLLPPRFFNYQLVE